MKNNAVTEEAPAVSDRNQQHGQLTIEETMAETGFLPQDEHYRLTGELKDSKEEKETSAAKPSEETTTEDGDETAAASEAASTQKETERKKGPATTKTAKSSENRWQKRERELKELKDKVKQLESAPAKRETEQVSQPAAAADTKSKGAREPQLDDVDPKTGKALFASWKEWQTAHSAWNRGEAIREFQETSAKTERERSLAQAEQTIEKVVSERAAKARETHDDYDDVIGDAMAQKNEHGGDAFFYTKGSHLDGFFLDSERGHDVMYAIAKDFDAHRAIFARDAKGNYLMNPVRQIKELTKIEASLEAAPGKAAAASRSSATPITKVGRPPHQVAGKGIVTKDTVEQAVDDGDFETYRHKANAEDLARLQRK